MIRRIILSFASLFLLAVATHAQTPIQVNEPNASIAVCNFPEAGFPCINQATIYRDVALTQPINQPVSLGPSGQLLFYVTNGSTYRLQVYGGANSRQYLLYTSGGTFSGGTVANPAQFNSDVFFKSGRPWYSVKAFGAVCDDVTDNSAAFAAARDAAIANDGIAYIDACTGDYKYKVSLNSLDNTSPNSKGLYWLDDAGLFISGGSLTHGNTWFYGRSSTYKAFVGSGSQIIPQFNSTPKVIWTTVTDVSALDIEANAVAVTGYYFHGIHFTNDPYLAATKPAALLHTVSGGSINDVTFDQTSFATYSCPTSAAYQDDTNGNVSFGRYFIGGVVFQAASACPVGDYGVIWRNVGDVRIIDGSNWWIGATNHWVCDTGGFCGGVRVSNGTAEDLIADFNTFDGSVAFINFVFEAPENADAAGPSYFINMQTDEMDGLSIENDTEINAIFNPAGGGIIYGFRCTGGYNEGCTNQYGNLSPVVKGGFAQSTTLGRAFFNTDTTSCSNTSTNPCHTIFQDTGNNSLAFYSRNGSTPYGGLQGVSGGIKSSAALQTTATTFSALPVCSGTTEGMIRAVTDSTTTTWGATITGSGTNHVSAYCNGTNWTVYAK